MCVVARLTPDGFARPAPGSLMFSESPGSGGQQDREIGRPAPERPPPTNTIRMDGCAAGQAAPGNPKHGAAQGWVESRNASNCEAQDDPLRFTGRQGAAGSKIERSGGRPPVTTSNQHLIGWMVRGRQ